MISNNAVGAQIERGGAWVYANFEVAAMASIELIFATVLGRRLAAAAKA